MGGANYETVTLPVHAQQANKTCGSAFITPDLGTLVACGNGAGHCYPSSKVATPELPECAHTGDVCVPDAILRAGGKKAKSCTFFTNGKPGACTSVLIKSIADNKDVLHQEDCAADERCAPCIDPRDAVTNTHVCDPVGVHGEACEAGAAQANTDVPCCHYAGVCLNQEAVPSGSRENMSRNTCAEGRLCAPAALVNGMPEKCDVLGADGVCIDLCFASMLGSTALVTRAGCGPTEVCLPCAIGKGQGMPGCN